MKTKHFVQLGVIVAFVVAFLLIFSNLLQYQCTADEIRMNLYYNEQQNSFDVMLYGPSAVRAGFIPTKAYENYGITSYNYAINSAPFPIIQYMLEESLRSQSPKVIVIDINSITYCNKEYTSSNAVAFTENIKNDTIKQKINKNVLNKEEKLEDNFALYNYHSNWQNMGECLNYKNFFDNYGTKSSILKGYTTYYAGVYQFNPSDLIDTTTITQKAEFNAYELQAVNSLFDYCDTIKENIKIVFAKLPRLTLKNNNEHEVPYINTLEQMIVQKGYTFINYATKMQEIGIDPTKHFADFTHLNHFGAEIFTNYLCESLIANYALTPSHGDQNEHWQFCVSVANEFYKEVKNATTLNNKKEYGELTLFKNQKAK